MSPTPVAVPPTMTRPPVADQAAVLELHGVGKTYPGPAPTTALQDVDLTIARGEQVAVVGPSGSGKSTLLAIAGALDRPTTGSVHIAGTDLAYLADRSLAGLRAARLGFVFQQFHLLDARTAVDNVADGALYLGWSRADRRRAATDLLHRMGLGGRLDFRARTLSGGERQRVAIARALIGAPDLILADEPTGNLDSATAAAILALLHDLAAEGRTVVVITHDLEVADSFPRTVVLRDGRVVADPGTPAMHLHPSWGSAPDPQLTRQQVPPASGSLPLTCQGDRPDGGQHLPDTTTEAQT